MKRGLGAAVIAALVWAGAETMGAGAPQAGTGNDAQTQQALAAVEKVLRGERVDDMDLKNLDNAVIRLESGGGGSGIGAGVEASAGDGRGGPRNVYILRFDSGAGSERQVQVLRIQREILKNQLVLLKSLSTIANYQVSLGTRTARVENIMRDMTLGMKSSESGMRKVAGDTAGTSAKMTDVASTTTDMAAGMKEMSQNINEIEGAIGNVDSMIEKMARSVESQGDETQRGIKRMGRRIETRIDESTAETIRQDRKDRDEIKGTMDSVGSDLSSQLGEMQSAPVSAE